MCGAAGFGTGGLGSAIVRLEAKERRQRAIRITKTFGNTKVYLGVKVEFQHWLNDVDISTEWISWEVWELVRKKRCFWNIRKHFQTGDGYKQVWVISEDEFTDSWGLGYAFSRGKFNDSLSQEIEKLVSEKSLTYSKSLTSILMSILRDTYPTKEEKGYLTSYYQDIWLGKVDKWENPYSDYDIKISCPANDSWF